MNNENNTFSQNANNAQTNPIQQYNNITQQRSADKTPDQNKKTSTNITIAIISIICSLVSIFIFWWLACIGLGLGIRVLREAKKTDGKEKTLAIISIIIAAISLILCWTWMILSKIKL